jgi:hypothetical protein
MEPSTVLQRKENDPDGSERPNKRFMMVIKFQFS